MHLRRLWPAALLALAPVLAACGGDDGDSGDDATPTPTPTSSAPVTPTEEPTTDDATTAPTTEAATLPAACDIVSATDVADAYGVTVGPAEVGGGGTSEGDLAWSSDDCSFEADDLVEVTVKLTGPDDFSQGAFGCPQPGEIASIVEPADDIAGATDGWWKVSDSPPLEATLRACTDAVLLEIELDYEDGVDYEGDPRNQSIGLAEQLLTTLAG